jgi:hypothetical protein
MSSIPTANQRRMTVAHVRGRGTSAEVLFFESARIYRLALTGPDLEAALALLERARATRRSVLVHTVEGEPPQIASVVLVESPSDAT